MEKKQSKWIWKTVVAACIAMSILSYMCIPSVKNMMNKIVAMFAAGLMILFALSAFVVMVRKIYIENQGGRNEKEIRNIRNYDGAVHDSGGRMRPESRK